MQVLSIETTRNGIRNVCNKSKTIFSGIYYRAGLNCILCDLIGSCEVQPRSSTYGRIG